MNIRPTSARQWKLYRDGKLVRLFIDETAMWNWLHVQHSYSISHAFKHEGYTATMPDGRVYQAY